MRCVTGSQCRLIWEKKTEATTAYLLNNNKGDGPKQAPFPSKKNKTKTRNRRKHSASSGFSAERTLISVCGGTAQGGESNQQLNILSPLLTARSNKSGLPEAKEDLLNIVKSCLRTRCVHNTLVGG